MDSLKLVNPFQKPSPFLKHPLNYYQHMGQNQYIPRNQQTDKYQYSIGENYRREQKKDKFNIDDNFKLKRICNPNYTSFEKFLLTKKHKGFRKEKETSIQHSNHHMDEELENPFYRKFLMVNESELREQIQMEISMAGYRHSSDKLKVSYLTNNYHDNSDSKQQDNYNSRKRMSGSLNYLQSPQSRLGGNNLQKLKKNYSQSRNTISEYVPKLMVNESIQYSSAETKPLAYHPKKGKAKIIVRGKQFFSNNLGIL